MEEANLPLEGLKVIDCTTLLAGGMMTMLLADFGAEVIKVEHPKKGDSLRVFGQGPLKNGASSWWTVFSRNKKTITLDLSREEGKELFKRLIKDADILVENFRTGTFEKWGIGYNELKTINSRIIMVSITGFGQTGPYRNRTGFGTLAEAMSGYSHITGYADGPPTLPAFALADGVTALTGAYSLMFAVYHRDVKGTGEGQHIDLTLYEPLLTVLGPQITEYDQLGFIQQRLGSRIPYAAPRNIYRTNDGQWVAVSASSPAVAQRVFQAIGRAELIQDPRFKDNVSRVANVDELDKIVGSWIGEHSADEVIQKFEECGAAVGPIYDVSQLLGDRHVKARESIVEINDPGLGKIKMQNVMPKFSKTPGRIRHVGQHLGQDNHEVYIKKLGVNEAEFTRLRAEGII